MKALNKLNLQYTVKLIPAEGLSQYNHAVLNVLNEYNTEILTINLQNTKGEHHFYGASYTSNHYVFGGYTSTQERLMKSAATYAKKHKVHSFIANAFPEEGQTQCQLKALMICFDALGLRGIGELNPLKEEQVQLASA